MSVDTTLGAIQDNIQSTSLSLTPQKTFAEFFAGIGLMRMGLEQQGWSISFANDIDPQKYEMYKTQFSDTDDHFLLGDIHGLSAGDIPPVTLATASFPCNDLSLAGARHGLKGKQSSAFWGFTHILDEMGEGKPPIVLIENVPGFLTSHKGGDFRGALLELNRLGYVVDSFILDAIHFVPQSRARLFIIGIQEEESALIQDSNGAFSFLESDVRPKALADFIFNHPEINWRLRDLPSQPRADVRLETILEDLQDGATEWWNTERSEYLLNQMSDRHRDIADRMIAGEGWSYGTVFRRVRKGKSMAELRTDGIVGCLRTPRGAADVRFCSEGVKDDTTCGSSPQGKRLG